MVKRLLLGLFVVVSPLAADWIDDCAQIVESHGTLDTLKATALVKSYVTRDEKAIERLEKKLEANDEDGFWAFVWGTNYQIQWASVHTSLAYHKKVLEFIKELSKNEQASSSFVEQLRLLKKLEKELIELKEAGVLKGAALESLKALSKITAKKLQIEARKAFIRSSLIL